MIDYDHIPGLEGQPNPPGEKKTLLLAPISWFEAIAPVAGPDALDATRYTIATDHTFKTGKGWIKVYTTLDTLHLTAESIGERDSRGHDVKIEFFHPGTKKQIMAFAQLAQNDEFIALAQGLDGAILQVGAEDLGADILSNYDGGTVSSGRRGTTFTLQSYAPLYLYEGAIVEKPAEVEP